MALVTLALVCVAASLVRADPPPFDKAQALAYDKGKFGAFPLIRYETSNLVSPRVLRREWQPSCDASDDQYYLFAPYGAKFNGFQGPMLLDHHGHMVWHNSSFPGRAYGLMVQEWRGEDYLTFWSGSDKDRGHGDGSYYMLNSSYHIVKKVDPPQKGLTGDLHEFKIQDHSTAIITSFHRAQYDLTPWGASRDGWVWDCVFQEIDLETSKVKFEWHSKDHFAPGDCMHPILYRGSNKDPWDYFHINSVDKDPLGNYLISARYCAITYIDGRSGERLWHLGGKNNQFKDLSGGKATNMQWQHDARWVDNYGAMTLFSNEAKSNLHPGVPSRGLKLEIDQNQMTARLLNELIHPKGWIGESQGSTQELENGNFLIGYGFAGAFTEFSPTGDVICDVQYAALHAGANGAFLAGGGQSYRVFKQRWVGHPHWTPAVAFPGDGSVMYISWNGATEVRSWRVEATEDFNTWHAIEEAPKSGFESNITVARGQKVWESYRVTALDRKGHPLGSWIALPGGMVRPTDIPLHAYVSGGLASSSLPVVIITVMLLIAIVAWRRCRRGNTSLPSWRNRHSGFATISLQKGEWSSVKSKFSGMFSAQNYDSAENDEAIEVREALLHSGSEHPLQA